MKSQSNKNEVTDCATFQKIDSVTEEDFSASNTDNTELKSVQKF